VAVGDLDNVGRPLALVEGGEVVREVFGG